MDGWLGGAATSIANINLGIISPKWLVRDTVSYIGSPAKK